jgi:hypothetical protein
MERDDAQLETEDKVTPAPGQSEAGSEASKTPAGSARDTGSILDDGDEGHEGSEGSGSKTPAQWREDWREALAAGDEKRLAQLKRFTNPESLGKSYWALQQKISSGEYVRKLPENASEEDKAKWREEMGVPKAPTDYEIPELDSYEWTEQDEPILESFLTDLHAADVPQPVVDAALGWYGKFVAQQKEEQHLADKEDKERATDELRANWNNEFRPNLKLVDRYLSDSEIFPDGFKQLFAGARAPDGRLLINKPGVADWLLNQAKDKYGEGAMLYGDARTNTTNRLAEIEKILQTDPSRYFREKLDEEALEIRRKLEAAEGRKRG